MAARQGSGRAGSVEPLSSQFRPALTSCRGDWGFTAFLSQLLPCVSLLGFHHLSVTGLGHPLQCPLGVLWRVP